MRISDWSSDVCSSDLSRNRGKAISINAIRSRYGTSLRASSPASSRTAVALDWLRKASSVTAGSSCTGSSRKRSESAIDRLLERIDAEAAIGIEETHARLARTEEHTSALQSLMRIAKAILS